MPNGFLRFDDDHFHVKTEALQLSKNMLKAQPRKNQQSQTIQQSSNLVEKSRFQELYLALGSTPLIISLQLSSAVLLYT